MSSSNDQRSPTLVPSSDDIDSSTTGFASPPNLSQLKHRTVGVDCEAMPEILGDPLLRFYSLEGEEGLSRLFDYTLVLRTPDSRSTPSEVTANIDVKPMIGQRLTVSVQLNGADTSAAGERQISGIVTRAGFLRKEGDFYLYQLSLRPWLWLATLNTEFKIFQDLSVLEIADQILQKYPYPVEKRLDHQKYQLDSESPRNEHRRFQVQYGESDFAFLQRVLSEYGIYWCFKHLQGHHTLVLIDGPAGHQLPVSEAYHSLAYSPQAEQSDEDYLHQFSQSETLRPGRLMINDYDFTRPRANLAAVNQQPLPHPLNEVERFEWPGDYSDSKHGNLISRVRMEQIRSSGWRASARGNVRGVACGDLFRLTGHSHMEANQEYVILAALLTLRDVGEESGAQQHCECSQQLVLQPSREVYRPPAQPKPEAQGPQTATVVGPAGKEIWTDEFGRVKLQFHWDRYARGDESDSCWVRVSQAWAGQGFGSIFIPRIGQEVIVGFLNGDPDRPIVLGSLYNKQMRPPWELPANATQSGVLSRSSTGGESDNANALRFEDQKGREEVWLHAEKDQRIEVENNESTFVGNNRSEDVRKNETISIGGYKTETVALAKALTIGLGYQTTVGGAMNTTVGLTQTEQVGLSKDVRINKTFRIDAGDEFAVTVGKSSLVMKSDGTVLINGTTFEFTASGHVQVAGKVVDIN
ncbi:type VI secretion system tip protein TssI/VgrG [Achromobacter seleniivolatilans]|uniref:Type VI secretion system tip protein TssI/VgrG n=1 Tax=Achromobacter seleniivolatilans TaxID=3047478 RepID=A0ABY9M532_9BURK|nr:type VI secretion system tip protein TssI/VgrG [Achromobacter sp. R39]WMD22109.1 type VI secretion system tip protein TssI/VgrG [Achromobacter sp. R39]